MSQCSGCCKLIDVYPSNSVDSVWIHYNEVSGVTDLTIKLVEGEPVTRGTSAETDTM